LTRPALDMDQEKWMRKNLMVPPVLTALALSSMIGAAPSRSGATRAQTVPLPLFTPAGMHPMRAPRIPFRFGTSTNWCGYVADGSNVMDVKGTWTVPGITPGGCGNSYSAAWVGIDGDNSNTVEQCGTEQDSSGQYYAWYEMYPKGSATVGPVSPGDVITAEVKFVGGGNFQLTMTRTRNRSTVMILNTTQKLNQARRTSAEWIMEAPWSGGVLPLANFGTMGFSGCQSIGSTSSPQSINMVNSSGTPKADISSNWNGSGFSVSWLACQ
jgi:hypothetical protein